MDIPTFSKVYKTVSPIIELWSWPPAHPEPWLANDVNNRYGMASEPYFNWLIRSPVPAYSSMWPVPLSQLAKYVKHDWWQAAGPNKYGHTALRLLPYMPDKEQDVIPASWDIIRTEFKSFGTSKDIGDLLGNTFQSRRLASFFDFGFDILLDCQA